MLLKLFGNRSTKTRNNMTANDRDALTKGLYEALKHGDAEHSAWLYDAIYAYLHDQVVPPVRGSGNKEARIQELEAEIFRLKAKYEC
jgi:hypothetical protein